MSKILLGRWGFILMLYTISGASSQGRAYGQSNEELLEMIRKLRTQIEAQQKQLRELEEKVQ